MTVFEEMYDGKPYDIRDEKYQSEAIPEMSRCRPLCFEINGTEPNDNAKLWQLENELLCGNLPQDSFLMPPFQIDFGCNLQHREECACQPRTDRHVTGANHD